MQRKIVEVKPIINVIPKFDLEAELYEARQRCFWFIDKFDSHNLTPVEFNILSTETICTEYGIDLSFFRG